MRHFYLFLLIVSGIVLSGTRMIAQSRPSVGSIRVVSGTIVDENNKAMANIVIYIKGTDIRVISDTDGYFSLPLKDTKDHVLIPTVTTPSRQSEIFPREKGITRWISSYLTSY